MLLKLLEANSHNCTNLHNYIWLGFNRQEQEWTWLRYLLYCVNDWHLIKACILFVDQRFINKFPIVVMHLCFFIFMENRCTFWSLILYDRLYWQVFEGWEKVTHCMLFSISAHLISTIGKSEYPPIPFVLLYLVVWNIRTISGGMTETTAELASDSWTTVS